MAAGDLTTLAYVKSTFEPSMTTTTRDALIAEYITAASMAIVRATDREWAPVSTQTRTFEVPIDSRLVDFGAYDLQSASLVTLNPEDAASSQVLTPGVSTPGVVLLPLQSVLGTYKMMRVDYYANVFTNSWILYGFARVAVEGTWGVPVIPPDVAQACALTVRSWMRQNPAAYAFADVDRESGGVTPEAPATFAIPPGAWRLLRPYMRQLV